MTMIEAVVTRYGEPNALIAACLRSLAAQQEVRLHVWFLDQRPGQVADAELAALCAELSSASVTLHYQVIEPRSLSDARNQGLARARADIVLFVDADATVDCRWAAELAGTFCLDPRIALVGGCTRPAWPHAPRWFHRTSLAHEVYSLRDQGAVARPDRNIIGVNFGLHRQRLGPLAHFNPELGRRPGSLLGGEEEELCERARAAGQIVYYNGRALVHHHIQTERMALGWLVRRFYYAGFERGARAQRPEPLKQGRSLSDLALALLVAPGYTLGFVRARRIERLG